MVREYPSNRTIVELKFTHIHKRLLVSVLPIVP
jgi:hypothetical protein